MPPPRPALVDARRLGPLPWRDLTPSLAGLLLGLIVGATLVGIDTVASAQATHLTGKILLWGTLPVAGILGALASWVPTRRDLLALAACTVAVTYPFLATVFQSWMLLPGLALALAVVARPVPDRLRIAVAPLLLPILMQSVAIIDPHPSQLALSGAVVALGLVHMWGALAPRSPWRAVPYMLLLGMTALLAAAGLLGLQTAARHGQFARGAFGLLVLAAVAAHQTLRFWRTDVAARWHWWHLRVSLAPVASA
ncbi:MAG TPA: hypothetical protein VM286_01930 [Candidatus Thermoplasmatota archaeon]|nr:hypothetical protein [Candidatus Thermoplasmatota archaeon]